MDSVIQNLTALWEAVSPFTGAVIAVAVTAGVVMAVRLIIKQRQGAMYLRQVSTLLIILVGAFASILFLPIGGDLKKEILSLLGILLSAVIALSSTSLIGNAMAGIMLRVNKSYRPGDFIEVGDTRGRVFNRGLFSTEVQIITRDTVSFPNLYLIQRPIRVTRSDGSFISAAVSLGYDVAREEAETALIGAAEKVGLAEPFVYVERLLDHAVEYRVFGLLDETSRMLTCRSDLRKAVLDSLHGRGIEIVSPSFVNRREFGEDRAFIPRAGSARSAPVKTESAVEEIAFDRAEEA